MVGLTISVSPRAIVHNLLIGVPGPRGDAAVAACLLGSESPGLGYVFFMGSEVLLA